MALELIQWLSRVFKDPSFLHFPLLSSPHGPVLSGHLPDFKMNVAQSFTPSCTSTKSKEMIPAPHIPALCRIPLANFQANLSERD